MEQVPRVVRGIPVTSGLSCVHRTVGLKRQGILGSFLPRNPGWGNGEVLSGDGESFPKAARRRGVGEVALWQSPRPFPGSEQSQAPPPGAEAPGGGHGKGTS